MYVVGQGGTFGSTVASDRHSGILPQSNDAVICAPASSWERNVIDVPSLAFGSVDVAVNKLYNLQADPATYVILAVTWPELTVPSLDVVVIVWPGQILLANVNVDVGPTTETDPLEGAVTWISRDVKPLGTTPVSNGTWPVPIEYWIG